MKHRIESLGKASVCLFILSTASMASFCRAGTARLDPVDYIKPIIGTNGTKRCGRTIPGPYVPFGMVQLSPDTRTGRGSTNGYNYRENTIEGFSYEQCIPFTGDEIRHRVTWEESDISRLEGSIVRLEFKFRNSDLFSFVAQGEP